MCIYIHIWVPFYYRTYAKPFFLNKDSKGCILAAFETISNCIHNFENKDAKKCILTPFETIWNCSEKG